MTTTSRELPLRLSGSPYERGRTHGRVWKQQVREVITLWRAELEKEYGLPADDIVARFVKRTDFLPSIEKWTPELLDEIRGIADGCGLDFDTVFSFQCTDEIWANSDRIAGEHCTSFGLPGNAAGPTLLAQTIDVETFRDGYQAVLHVNDDTTAMASLLTTCVGSLGFNGVNHHGVAVCCNAQLQLHHATEGLPVAFVLRGVLQRLNAAAALDFLSQVPHATGQHYLVGDPDEIHSIECSSAGVTEFSPNAEHGLRWHTNHPLASEDLQDWYRELVSSGNTYPFLENSRARLAILEAALAGQPARSRFDQFSSILAQTDDPHHPICSDRTAGTFYSDIGLFTFASTLMVLSDVPELHVTLGPPCRTPRHVLKLNAPAA